MDKYLINIIGLCFDITGAYLLFKYGLPNDLNKKGTIFLSLEQVDLKEIEKYKKYEFWSKIGLTFLILGFLFQLISTVLSWDSK